MGAGIKKLGVHESDCFDTVDLYKGQDIGKVLFRRPQIDTQRARSFRARVDSERRAF